MMVPTTTSTITVRATILYQNVRDMKWIRLQANNCFQLESHKVQMIRHMQW
jgi:hypothetical protein